MKVCLEVVRQYKNSFSSFNIGLVPGRYSWRLLSYWSMQWLSSPWTLSLGVHSLHPLTIHIIIRRLKYSLHFYLVRVYPIPAIPLISISFIVNMSKLSFLFLRMLAHSINASIFGFTFGASCCAIVPVMKVQLMRTNFSSFEVLPEFVLGVL